MKLENIKRLVKQFNNEDYKELVGALIVFEKMDYLQDLEDLTDKDIEKLEEIYYEWLHSDISGLLDTDLKDIIDSELESEIE